MYKTHLCVSPCQTRVFFGSIVFQRILVLTFSSRLVPWQAQAYGYLMLRNGVPNYIVNNISGFKEFFKCRIARYARPLAGHACSLVPCSSIFKNTV